MTTTALDHLKALVEAEAIIHKSAARIFAEPTRTILVPRDLLENAAGVLQELQAAMGSDAISRKAMDNLTTDAQATYEAIEDQLEIPTTEMAMPTSDDGWEKVDTLHGHTRHLAKIAQDGAAHTKCGKRIVHYFRVRFVGEGLSKKHCKGCQ